MFNNRKKVNITGSDEDSKKKSNEDAFNPKAGISNKQDDMARETNELSIENSSERKPVYGNKPLGGNSSKPFGSNSNKPNFGSRAGASKPF